MIPVNGPSFGRRGGLPRRYPGGTENDSILRTVLRSSPNTREASRVLIPSTRHARRTRAYISTRYIPPPSSQSNPDRRLYAVPFWSATAGSTGRFSGGLLRRRSQAIRRAACWRWPWCSTGRRGRRRRRPPAWTARRCATGCTATTRRASRVFATVPVRAGRRDCRRPRWPSWRASSRPAPTRRAMAWCAGAASTFRRRSSGASGSRSASVTSDGC